MEPKADEDKEDSSDSLIAFEDSGVCVPISTSCKKEESLKTQYKSKSSIPYLKCQEHNSEAESPAKKVNVSTEDDVSDLESGSSLSRGEVPVAKRNEDDDMETSNVCEANFHHYINIFLIQYMTKTVPNEN